MFRTLGFGNKLNLIVLAEPHRLMQIIRTAFGEKKYCSSQNQVKEAYKYATKRIKII